VNTKSPYLAVEVRTLSSLLGIFADGEKGVGKSSLTGQFVSHMWTERYDPTIEDAFRKEITVDGHECVLEMYFPPRSSLQRKN
jgi:hypothetical protein